MPFLVFGLDRIEAGLFFSEYERTTADLRRQLREMKERIRDSREPEYLDLGNYRFEVQPHTGGAPWYDYFLKHPQYLVWVGEEERGEQPPVRVAILSETLWTLGPWFAWANLVNLLESTWGLRYERSKVSRIDPCVDQDLHILSHKDLRDVVCRGRYVGPYDPTAPDADSAFDARVWMQRRRGELPLTGLQLGRRAPLLARLYNKYLEIVQASGKRWMWKIWQEAGWEGFRTLYDPDTGEVKGREPITEPWRIEFEVHREVLRAIAAEPDGPTIESVEDAFELMPQLWRYLTADWLRFVNKKKRTTNTTRARVRRWWRQVQNPPPLPQAPAAVRIQPALSAKEDVYARSALGYLASLGGLWQTEDLRTVMRRLEKWAKEADELVNWVEKAQTRRAQLNPIGVKTG